VELHDVDDQLVRPDSVPVRAVLLVGCSRAW
jgi:hypothetical protein